MYQNIINAFPLYHSGMGTATQMFITAKGKLASNTKT